MPVPGRRVLVPDTPADADGLERGGERGCDSGESEAEAAQSDDSGRSPRKPEHGGPAAKAAGGTGTGRPAHAPLGGSGDGSGSDSDDSGSGSGDGGKGRRAGQRSWLHGDDHGTTKFIQELVEKDKR